LKLAGKTPAPSEPSAPTDGLDFGGDSEPTAPDAGGFGDDLEAPKDDKPFKDEPFDAGVEADEESDPKKFIQQLTGKLGQSLRKYNDNQGQPDLELEKFAINSLLSATHTSDMDSNDQEDIIKKVKEAGNNDNENNNDNKEDNGFDSGDNSGDNNDNDSGSDMGFGDNSGEPKDTEENVEEQIFENYDLISQFKGDHHGNPMEKNKYLNALGLDENSIGVLETIINLMDGDRQWKTEIYPNGSDYVAIISDISKVTNDLKGFIEKYQSTPPVKVANFLKTKIKESKGVKESESLFLDNPKKNNMFQPGSNDKLKENLENSKIISTFDKNSIKNKLKETFNQEEDMESNAEPMVKPAPITKPSPVKEPNKAPSRRNKPFLPMPSVQPDPKAKG
jgi:hypothetical protein